MLLIKAIHYNLQIKPNSCTPMLEHIIEDSNIYVRIDKYLKVLYPKLTQGVIERYIRKKLVKINSKTCKAQNRVKKNDQIHYPKEFEKYKITPKEQINKISSSPKIKTIAKKISSDYRIYEDEDLLVINKPSNLASQLGSKVTLSINCALNYINYHLGYNLHIVHRLDKETSGVMIFAKNKNTATVLTKAFANQRIVKNYISFNLGIPKIQSSSITSTESNKISTTKYTVLKTYADNICKILWQPLTGRKHQIRKHALLLNCPIIGDKKYKNQECQLSDKLLLHSLKLELPDEILPNTKIRQFYCDYCQSFDKSIEKI